MKADVFGGGFADAPVQSAHAFRAALEVLARPGRIERVAGVHPPAPLSVGAGVLLLTLADATTPVWLAPSHDHGPLRDWLRFHCGSPFAPPGEAMFAVGTWDALQPLGRFAIGTPDYPDRSATLIVEHPGIDRPNARLSGPGIRGEARLGLPGLAEFAANRALYPLGLDVFLASGDRIAGLPRSTIVEAL
jgi:alpha-D-ribose 1-methylphosphonate 5-triphosphate synthase subunit PhnH